MGDRDAGDRGNPERRRHAGNDLPWHTGPGERLDFLAAAPEKKRVPPFKRTTVWLRFPCSTRSRLISSWRAAPGRVPSGRLPTSMSSADTGARARTE